MRATQPSWGSTSRPSSAEISRGALLEAFHRSEEDRRQVERSLERVSDELVEKNRELQGEVLALRQMQRELAKSEASFRSMIERSPDLIVVHRDGVVLYANPSFCEALGRSAEAVIGTAALDYIVPEDRNRVQDRMRTVVAGGFAEPAHVHYLHASGQKVDVEAVGSPVQFEGEAATLVMARNITDRMALEERLRISDRMASLGTLAAGVAHEINNPLAFLVANLTFVRDEMSRDDCEVNLERWIAVLSEAVVGADRVERIVRDLKVFSRPQVEQELTFDAAEVVRSAVNMAAPQVKHRAMVNVDLEGELTVRGSASKLGQVFLNLLVNAGQAIAEGAPHHNRVEVRGRRVGDRLTISFSDSGCGMTDEVRQRIFEPFFTTKAVGVGTGLGLAISSGIIRSMGGEIEVESAPGKGTTFRVSLPAVARDAPSAPPQASEKAPAAPCKRVLIVADEVLLAKSLKRRLDRSHEVVVVHRAQLALDRPDLGSFDVILCDLMMPEMTGPELYATLRLEHPEVAERMIFLTGGAFSAEMRAFTSELAERCLDKPVDMDALSEKMNSLSRPASGP